MPYRRELLAVNEYYHVYNRGVNKQKIFLSIRDYYRAFQSVKFYQFAVPPRRFSYFMRLPNEERMRIWKGLEEKNRKLIEIIAYVFMPNHYHLLLKQVSDHGISKFMARWQDSYTKYVNTRHDRVGPLMQGQFKAVRVVSNSQLLHVSRYIHLNPYTASLVPSIDVLIEYQWSSLGDYLGTVPFPLSNTAIVLGQFKNMGQYRDFVFDQADYQKQLDQIKHLALE